MKKFLILMAITFFTVLSVKAELMPFAQAFSATSNKPALILVYAKWADGYSSYIQNFKAIQAEFGTSFNYTELDIASNDAKSFNDKFHIYPKLPYILMFRDGGKVSRYIPRDCASNISCVVSKVKSFIQ